MCVRNQIVNLAITESKNSDYYHKIGAVIWKKKNIISIGHNYPLRGAKHLHPRFQKWYGSIHAEADAILRARTDLVGCNILVVRTNRRGEFRNAKPCKICMEYLAHVKIKNIYYSVDEYPFIKKMSMKDYENKELECGCCVV